MRYIRVYNESASPVILKGLMRTYVVNGRNGRDPMIEDIPVDDVYYINGRCDVFRTGRLHFDESEVDAIMNELRNPAWRDRLLTDAMVDDIIMHPSPANLRRIVECSTRPEIERFRAAMVSLQNANHGVADIVSRTVRDRFAEIANGMTVSRIKLPNDEYFGRFENKRDQAMEAMQAENEAMKMQMAEMQKKLEALLSAKEKPEAVPSAKEKPEKSKTTRQKAPKAESIAE